MEKKVGSGRIKIEPTRHQSVPRQQINPGNSYYLPEGQIQNAVQWRRPHSLQRDNQSRVIPPLMSEIHPNALRRPPGNQGNPNPRTINQPQQSGVYQTPHRRNPQPRNNSKNRPNNQQTQGTNDNRNRPRNFHVGFKKLEEWSNKDPDTIIVELIGQKLGFEELLDSNLSGDCIVLVLKILSKLCLSPYKENKTQIMNLASKENFIENLQKYVMMLQLQEKQERRSNMHFWTDTNGFFNNLTIIFQSIIETLPTRACEVLPKMLKAVSLTIPTLEISQGIKITNVIKEKLQKLQEKLDLCIIEVERKKKAVHEGYDDESPPDDFRQLSVYPTNEEILTNEQPFVRKHIIEGAYEDVNHYLDVQFRLLKEDFVAPLREGVCSFIHQEQTKHRISRISNVRIHPHVEFLCPRFGRDQVGVLLQFDFRNKNKNTKQPPRNFKNSRRFMFGSLVCFTKDDFATLVFGKIIERDMKLLEQGQIVIGFEPGYDNYELNTPYLMIECSVYFEPYYHVLKALQNMYEEGFPMKEYLIDVNPRIESPRYLTPQAIYKIHHYTVPLAYPGSWPSASNLHLDNTQYAAFQAALTQKFAVIQGPPGTGKTYLGLEVAKTLIKNRTSWYNRTPILVVCFTNHALDQFLEGLIDTTSDIVRVGGQSKNPKLEKFNLREKRKYVHTKKGVNKALYTLRNELSHQLASIKAWSEGLDEIQRYQSVVQFKHFFQLDPDFNGSWFITASEKDIRDWLFGGRTRQEQQKEMYQAWLQERNGTDEDNQNTEDLEMVERYQDENRARNEIAEDDLVLDMFLSASRRPTYLTTTAQMIEKMKEIHRDLTRLGDDVDEQAVFNKKWELEKQMFDAQDDFNYLTMRLNEGARTRITRKPPDLDLRHPHNMTPDDRWRLYFYWLNLYQESLIRKLVAFQNIYREKYRQYIEIKDIDDTEVMKQMLVVGMTTTGAARLQTTLQALQSRIVIVEEAAEVLESHIIVSLTNHCEHLILIGDHKQLRPSTANFRIEKHFNLGISLFERMVRNKIQCYVLGVQHRMRPEIAKLIVPNIYPTLENHPSVCNFPPVLGIDPCMYFIDHDHPEEETGDFSKLNKHEAEFLIKLARYLIQNGYEAEDITILAAYSGQMFALWKERKKYEILLKDVRITVLDNYQGEESKIILLSLVRNNKDKKIGFLRTENRVCVALSRAKEGFYMMGNMDLLCENSEIWPKVKDTLESQDFFGKSLTLRCQIHREEVLRVTCANDFDKVPEGGCSKVCEILLNCGHKCTKICHITDRAHEESKCMSPCSRILCENDHQCPKMCFEDCGVCIVPMKQTLTCGHQHVVPCYMDPNLFKCPTYITAKLPCGHTVDNKPCCINAETYRCPYPCDTRVEPCGHACNMKCHIRNDPDHLQYKCYKTCAKPLKGCSTGKHLCQKACYDDCPPCEIVIKKRRSMCAHVFDLPCNVNADQVRCTKPCKKDLPCGHKCDKKCYEPCQNCQVKVDKVLPKCGHTVKSKCSEEPNRRNCIGQCPNTLPCGHTCKNKCNEVCTIQCKELVEHTKPADCGHTFKIHCYMQNQEIPSNSYKLLQFCKEPCRAELKCKHSCSGTCGKCAQGRIHETCKEKCGVDMICGHECPIPCRETCQPCNQKCSYRCRHSKCTKRCGEPCTNCKERCGRRCEHVNCRAKCGDICTVPPCTEPCQKILQCQHPCVGFCGDPCPPLCRDCDKKELTEVFLGFEDEEGARFVLLDECKHVIESQGMEGWLQQGGNEINYKSCPKCKTPLASTQRYSDYIKKANKDVVNVKKKFFGDFKENEKSRIRLLTKLEEIEKNCETWLVYSPEMLKLLEDFKKSLKPVRRGKRQPLNMILARTYESKIQIIEDLVDTFEKAQLKNRDAALRAVEHLNFILRYLLKEEQRITNQEIIDIQRESRRFERITQLCQIEDIIYFDLSDVAQKPDVEALYQEVKQLTFSAKIFTNEADAYLKNKLVDFSKTVKAGIKISDKERKEILQAMHLGKGHWYKCPNGHIYAIGDCGGANQVGRCNECNAQIGGTNHSLVAGNAHAGEMDGSRHPAWSEGNNMLNYQAFRNIYN